MNKLTALAVAAVLATGTFPASGSGKAEPVRTIVLVHGAFVDGSGWSRVYSRLVKKGYNVAGAIISEVGTDPQVRALVYIAAFVPDAGESVSTLVAHPPAGSPAPPILAPEEGLLYLDKAGFQAAFAADVDSGEAQFMADSQLGWGGGSFHRRDRCSRVEDQTQLVPGGY